MVYSFKKHFHRVSFPTDRSLSRFLFLFVFLFAFTGSVTAQGKKRIEILNANSLKYDRNLGNNVRRLLGDVLLEHDGAYLNCDSAHLYHNTNSVEAFGHIYIKQGDTLHLYGDYLNYSGTTKLAELRNNVKLIDKETVLTTNILDFDLDKNLGYYKDTGRIVNGENHLASINGTYYSQSKIFYFQDSVVVINPDYIIYSDTMKYNTVSKVTTFFGPTEIISDSNYIYCEQGWYDTENDLSRFSGNAFLSNKNQTIKGDSLFYDRNNGLGEAYSNVSLYDSAQKIILKGNLGHFQENPEKSMLTDSALFIQILDEEDSLFLHADTLRSKLDSTKKHKILNAYYHVKMYAKDLQGICDSLSYSFADSVIRFYDSPCLWADENQLTSDYTELYTRNRKPSRIEMYGSAFIISKEDSLYFNQIKGKNMTGYFRDNEIYKIDVMGNGQTIYFPKDDGKIVGVNQAESSNIVLFIKDKKINRIKLINQPDGILTPEDKLQQNNLKLEGFIWHEQLRPLKVADIFR
jgi:lipopolysaccharide export system protein LptA